jgi:hypothetical protein
VQPRPRRTRTSMPSPPDGPEAEPSEGPIEEVEPKRIDYKAVARVSTQAELKTIRVAFLHADMDERNGPIPADWAEEAVVGLSAQDTLDRANQSLSVRCGFVAVYAPGLDRTQRVLPAPRDAPVEVHAHLVLTYGLKDVEVVLEGDTEHFALTNGMLHAWPYWRELAHNTTIRMGLAPLVIGMFKLPWTGDPGRDQEQPPGDSATASAQE